jgi:hypothetical protein
MKAATVHTLKQELVHRSHAELLELCLRLSKFKKENKELLSYLLFEAHDEESFISGIKHEVDLQFEEINRTRFYFVKKSIRKIQRNLRKYVRYSKKNETEVELMIYFCKKLKEFRPSIKRSRVMTNLFNRQVAAVEKVISKLDEDLQFDFGEELREVLNVES